MQTTNNIVRQGQCFLDKVLELTGNIENAMQMAVINGVYVTDSVSIGMGITAAGEVKKLAVSTWRADGPATDIAVISELKLEGISIWAINNDFKVGG